jgi:hypothetical protein
MNARRKLVIGVLVLLGASGLALGITRAVAASSSADAGDGAAVQFAPQTGSVPTLPGTPAEVVDALAARLPLVAHAHVVTTAISNEDGSSTNGLVLEYDVLVPSFDGAAVAKASWEGDLLTGAVVDEYAARGFGSLSEALATLVDPSGARRAIGGGFGAVVPNQVFNNVPSSMGAQVAAAAGKLGLTDVSFSTVQGLQESPVIVATTNRPQSAVSSLEQPTVVDALLGALPTQFEGTYLEVRDSAGNPIYIATTAARDGSSMVWTDPSVAAAGDPGINPNSP